MADWFRKLKLEKQFMRGRTEFKPALLFLRTDRVTTYP